MAWGPQRFLRFYVVCGVGAGVLIATVPYLFWLFGASQYALISAAASIVGRFLTGTTAGALIDAFGYVNFYLLTTALAVPGILLFWIMMRMGLIDASIGSAGTEGSGDVRAEHPDQEKPAQSGS